MQIDNINLLFAYENFQERLQEVQKYVDFVKYLADISHPSVISEASISWGESLRGTPHQNHSFEVDISPNSRYEINRDLQKTLRASTYLLLYNLMESTMSESINAIHETIKEEGHSILELSEKVHKVILNSFRKGLTESKVVEYSKDNRDIRESLLDLGYDKKRLFSGNIDYQVIKEYCEKYGIKLTPYKPDNEPLLWDSEIIRSIKQKRNALAHGSESFSYCGQNMPVDIMNSNLQSVEAVLMGVFNGLNNFLTCQKYLRTPQQT